MKRPHTGGLGNFIGSHNPWHGQDVPPPPVTGIGPIAQTLLTIYATVEDPNLWNAALTGLTGIFGATAAKLFLQDAEGRQLNFMGQQQLSLTVGKSRTGGLGAAEPRSSQNGPARAQSAIPPINGLQNIPLPRVAGHCIELPLSCGRLNALFGIYRDAQQDAFDAEEIVQIHSLFPHLHLALNLRQRMVSQDERLDLVGSVCDHLDHVVVIVDRKCRILHQTPRATQLLADAGAHAVPFEPLTLPDPIDQVKLQRAIAKPIGQAESRRLVFSSRNHRQISAGLFPLSTTSGFGFLEGPVAIIMSQTLETSQIEHRQLMNLFHLTATEANLAVDLSHGKRVAEIAEARGVSLTTVRAQLRAVLAKTETHRQLDLVLLLSQIAARGELANFSHSDG
jgi:DNA-binding CsgD family transcriptional regulator